MIAVLVAMGFDATDNIMSVIFGFLFMHVLIGGIIIALLDSAYERELRRLQEEKRLHSLKNRKQML